MLGMKVALISFVKILRVQLYESVPALPKSLPFQLRLGALHRVLLLALNKVVRFISQFAVRN